MLGVDPEVLGTRVVQLYGLCLVICLFCVYFMDNWEFLCIKGCVK